MFNFNTTKRQIEPTLNRAVTGAENFDSVDQDAGGLSGGQSQEEAYTNSRLNEIESQRIEFAQKNPNFDIKVEMENPEFVNYVWGKGLTIEEAYILVHHDEIITAAIQQALKRVSARRNRILENGAEKNSPAVVKKNPKEMSDKEVDKIIERVNNGEKISF